MAAEEPNRKRRDALEQLRKILSNIARESKESHDLLAGNRIEDGLHKFGDVLWELNRFLYLKTRTLEPGYISPFHQLWEQFAPEIIHLEIDDKQCLMIAHVLEKIHTQKDGRFQAPPERTAGLKEEQIANVRFITAAQDWKLKQRINPYEIAARHPEWFEPKCIAEDPPHAITRILSEMGVGPDQGLKRLDYAKNGANFLIEYYDGSAFNLGSENDFDASLIRKALIEPEDEQYREHIGFSQKKADMFIRDMYDFKVWSLKRIDACDVPPDINTMRIALRTGMLRTRHPLLASYLDIYSEQYGLVSQSTCNVWRRVWDLWGEIPGNHRVDGPILIDYLLYEMLARNCSAMGSVREIVCKKCVKTSMVKSRIRTCPHCMSTSISPAPGRGTPEELGGLLRRGCQFCVEWNDGRCIFEQAVTFDRWKLNPPKSISRIGGTGWDDGVAFDDEGGGGITA